MESVGEIFLMIGVVTAAWAFRQPQPRSETAADFAILGPMMAAVGAFLIAGTL